MLCWPPGDAVHCFGGILESSVLMAKLSDEALPKLDLQVLVPQAEWT